MRFFTVFAAMLFVAKTFAQDVKGYYVTTSGQRVEGYFNNSDYNDAASLKFKASRNAQFAGLSDDVVEYGVDEEKLKFEKHTVKIDVSANATSQKEPEWATQTLFLNVLVNGDARLYSYTKDYNTKFFFSKKDKPEEVSQLVFKKYKTAEGLAAENNMFRQQLYIAINCNSKQDVSEYAAVVYSKKPLIDVFVAYNSCMGSKSEVLQPKQKSNFKFTAIAGLYNTNLGITSAFPDVDDANDVNYALGIEAAYVFPSETTEIVFRAEFESLKVKLESSRNLGYNITTSIYDLNTVAADIYIGPRYNFLLNDNNKIFIDAAFGVSIPFGHITQSTIITPPVGEKYAGAGTQYDLQPGFCLNFGAGYTFGRYGIALRYETNRDFLDDTKSSYKTQVSRLGLNLRYTFN